MDARIRELIDSAGPLDAAAMKEAEERQAKLAKPPGSLGKLEDISIRLAGITGRVRSSVHRCRVIVFASDNGVIEEGVSSAPRAVTMTQAVNMTRRRTGMSALASYFGDDVDVVDVGIADDYDCPSIYDRKIARGTKNFYKEPAMTEEEAVRAILTGAEFARKAKEEGMDVIGIGEMGIGNTSTSTAVLCALTGADPETVTGRGGGVNDVGFQKKKQVIEESLARYFDGTEDVIRVLSCVGGYDLCAMCGAFVGAAAYRIPAVIDGFISVVAALCAKRLCPVSADYMFPSHVSEEPGYMIAVRELGLDPWLHLGMRLGEGSGCPVAFRVMEAACAVMDRMALFGEESAIDDGYLDEIRSDKRYLH